MQRSKASYPWRKLGYYVEEERSFQVEAFITYYRAYTGAFYRRERWVYNEIPLKALVRFRLEWVLGRRPQGRAPAAHSEFFSTKVHRETGSLECRNEVLPRLSYSRIELLTVEVFQAIKCESREMRRQLGVRVRERHGGRNLAGLKSSYTRIGRQTTYVINV